MRVSFDIDDHDWSRLRLRADSMGINVEDLVAEAVKRAVPTEFVLAEKILHSVGQGLPDPVIAERFGVSKGHVANVRRRAGLPANKFNRIRWDAEFTGQGRKTA